MFRDWAPQPKKKRCSINPHVSFYFSGNAYEQRRRPQCYGAVTWGRSLCSRVQLRLMHTSSLADAADLYQEDIIRRSDSIYYLYDGKQKVTQKQFDLK